jgi:hypothetical protein
MDFSFLLAGAAFAGTAHTIIGPDHYLPIVAMARSRQWSFKKTMGATLILGLGHTMSAILIAVLAIQFGLKATGLIGIESARGQMAGWILLISGLLYMLWTFRKSARRIEKKEKLTQPNQTSKGLLFWTLLVVFVIGPCEPLIPILFLSSANITAGHIAILAGTFTLTTLLTMGLAVGILHVGIDKIKINLTPKIAHALVGATISFCGVAILFLGL